MILLLLFGAFVQKGDAPRASRPNLRPPKAKAQRPSRTPPPNQELPLPEQVLARIKGHDGYITSVAFSGDGTLAASTDMNGAVAIWEVPALKESRRMQASRGAEIKNWAYSAKFSPDGRHLACGSQDKTVWLWELGMDDEPLRIRGHTTNVERVFFSPDGRGISIDWRTVCSWNPSDGEAKLLFQCGPGRGAQVSPDGKKLLVTGGELYDLPGGDKQGRLWGGDQNLESAEAMAFSPDSTLVAMAPTLVRHELQLWEIATTKKLWQSGGHNNTVAAVAFSAEGRKVLTTDADTIRVWETETGDEIGRFLISKYDHITCMASSPTGALALLGTQSGNLILFQVPDDDN